MFETVSLYECVCVVCVCVCVRVRVCVCVCVCKWNFSLACACSHLSAYMCIVCICVKKHCNSEHCSRNMWQFRWWMVYWRTSGLEWRYSTLPISFLIMIIMIMIMMMMLTATALQGSFLNCSLATHYTLNCLQLTSLHGSHARIMWWGRTAQLLVLTGEFVWF